MIIRRGDTQAELLSVVKETGAAAVYWTRRYEPAVIERDTQVKTALRKLKLEADSFNGQLLFEPWEVQTKEDRPYQVFTSFWKTCLSRAEPATPVPAPNRLVSPDCWPVSLLLDELKLLPKINWDEGLDSAWKPGTESAKAELQRFLTTHVDDYQTARDLPAEQGTSRMSPHLHFGEISPRMMWSAARRTVKNNPTDGLETFLKEVGWREFAYHLLYHFPQTTNEPLRSSFSRFPWVEDAKRLRDWQRGETGYPIVDAGMRELWSTGWMHNRVRMIVASFLVKDLLINWQQGAEWFWDTLVDADLASNTLGWQWSAGCGADAAPYFRIFNPELQSKKFDAEGNYIRKWIPELSKLPAKWIHTPESAPQDLMRAAEVELGKTYPKQCIDHSEARQRALTSLRAITGLR